jgi:hypothetical protein
MRYRQVMCDSDTVMRMQTVRRHQTCQEEMTAVDARKLGGYRGRSEMTSAQLHYAQSVGHAIIVGITLAVRTLQVMHLRA